MKNKVLKILKGCGIAVGSLLGGVILFWIILSITAGVNIPEGNNIDYVKGIWMATPPEQFRAYWDLDRIKEDEVNTISIGPFVTNHAMAIIQRPLIAHLVKKAHKKGLAVHIVPNCWGPWTDIHKAQPEKKDYMTKEAVYWAKFAQEYNVEYFSPSNEGDVLLWNEGGGKWAQEVLPDIRDVYDGEVVLKLGHINADDDINFDYRIKIESFSQEEFFMPIRFSNSTGYDYLMIDMFPSNEMTSNSQFMLDLEEILLIAQEEVEKKNLKGLMIGEFGYPVAKPEYSRDIMPGIVVSPETQALYIGEYLETAMPLVDGIMYCGWTMEGYGIRGYPAEEVVREWYLRY